MNWYKKAQANPSMLNEWWSEQSEYEKIPPSSIDRLNLERPKDPESQNLQDMMDSYDLWLKKEAPKRVPKIIALRNDKMTELVRAVRNENKELADALEQEINQIDSKLKMLREEWKKEKQKERQKEIEKLKNKRKQHRQEPYQSNQPQSVLDEDELINEEVFFNEEEIDEDII